MTRTLLLAAIFSFAASSAAFASETCSVPKAEWQPEQALRQKLETAGWKVSSIEIDDGCFEVSGTDANGKQVENYFDPKSLDERHRHRSRGQSDVLDPGRPIREADISRSGKPRRHSAGGSPEPISLPLRPRQSGLQIRP